MIPDHVDLLFEKFEVRGYHEGHDTIVINRQGFLELLKGWLETFPFDTDLYGKRNPDVVAAVRSGRIGSLQDHFLQSGYLEGRLSTLDGFDPERYCEINSDVRESLPKVGFEEGARRHFVEFGYKEKRRFR